MSKILICSQRENLRESLKLSLCDNYDLIECDTEEMCLQVISNTDISVFLLDLVTQNDPNQFIKKIKTDHPSIKIIAVTDSSKEKLAKDAIKAGASGFITKPIKSEELLAICK